jgi:probable rRNA maturation factor
MIEIDFISSYKGNALVFEQEWYQELSEIALSKYEIPKATLSLSILGNSQMQHINRDTRGIDSPTDVLSFPFFDTLGEILHQSISPIPLGEILLAPDVISTYADLKGYDASHENAFIFVHGVLHLLGFDHQTDEEEKDMNDRTQSIIDQYFS